MTDEDENAPALPAAKARRVTVGRKLVVNKLWRAARRQLEAHEAHLDGLPEGVPASESDAKALATLARTVRELVALEAATVSQKGKPADDLSPADGLRHVAELRQELARRLEYIAAGGPDSGPAASDGSGDA